MTRASKFGLEIIGIGLLVWGVPTLYLRYPIWKPLSSPLPLSPGASFRQSFKIRGTHTYFIYVQCKTDDEFNGRWRTFMNGKQFSTVPCDIGLRVIRDGQEIHSEHLEYLRPASRSGHVYMFLMTYLRLPSSNSYELLLTNATDLSYMQPTSPTVQVCLSEAFIKNAAINAYLGRITGWILLVIGLGGLTSGLLAARRPASPPAEVDGGTTSYQQLGS